MPLMQSAPGAETILDGRRYLYFAGTGYLGLQGHPDVIRAAADAVAAKLAAHLQPGQRPLVMSDGVFPSLGHIAPIPAYAEALARYPGGLICLDDAHGGGAIGPAGRGTFDYF